MLTNFKIWQQVGVLFVFMSLLLFGAAYLYITEKNSVIEFTNVEVMGTDYLNSLTPLFQSILMHRDAAAGLLGGNESFREKLNTSTSQIDEALKKLDEKDSKNGTLLKTTERLKTVKRKWESVNSNQLQLNSKESFNQHGELIEETLVLLVDLGDSSNITYDPDVDGYNLGQASLVQIPQAADSVGRLCTIGTSLIAKKQITNDDKTLLTFLASNAQTGIKSFKRNMSIVRQTNPELEGKIASLVRNTDNEVDSFLSMVTRLLQSDGNNIVVNGDEYFNSGAKATGEISKLNDTVVQLLSEAFSARESKLSRSKYMAIGILFGGLLVGAGLTFYIASCLNKKMQNRISR